MTGIVRVHAERPYQVHIGAGVSARLEAELGDAERVAVLHPATLRGRLEELLSGVERPVRLIEVPDAEGAKTSDVVVRCWSELAEAGFTRSDAVVGFGGGATTDLAGFVAATWLRGVRYVSVPTTVLGMVDAAVGGKTGINLPAGKNLVGAFHEPVAVLADLNYLSTLPDLELRTGLAEVVKAGFIADPRILTLIETDLAAALVPSSDTLAELIRRAVQVKADVVSADLREATSTGAKVGRELLNYGHTLGHAIERTEQYRWRHGAAISVGMVFAAELSCRAGLMARALVDRHRSVLTSLGLPISYRREAWPELRAAMNLDKKTRGSVLRFVVLRDLADPLILKGPEEGLLTDAYARIQG